jgi:putative redox protein
MATAKILYASDLITEAIHLKSGKRIMTDAPEDNNGKGSAFSPTDLVSAALVSCMITIMGIKANQLELSLGKIESNVTKIMGIQPRRITKLVIELNFEKEFEDEIRKQLEEAGVNCPVAKSLHPEIIQEVKFSYGVEV